MSVNFEIDLNKGYGEFPHYWEKCVGSGHAVLANREDWRRQLKKCHDELGFEYVRFHGILDDDMSVCVREQKFDLSGEPGKITYSFFNVDSIIDYLLEIGMKPFVELGFMPEALASGNQTCFHYKANVTPPAEYSEWEKLITTLVQHWSDRYGLDEIRSWFFEVWNEPNLHFFWAASQEEYFKLYRSTALAIKKVDDKLPVGGPATSINAWIPQFIDFCKNTGTPIDFISTHHYPTDDPLWKNSDLSLEKFFALHKDEFGKYERGILYKMTSKTKSECGELPLYYTEWNCSAILPDAVHDEPYAAAMIAKTIADNDGLVEGYAFWTFSDLFEESGQRSGPFHGGFGLQTIHGVPKPSYRLFEFMHQLGTKRLKIDESEKETVGILATKKDEEIAIVVYNHQIPEKAISMQDVSISIEGIRNIENIELYRIDEDNANPKKRWIEAGEKEYIDKRMIEELYEASMVRCEPIDSIIRGDTIKLDFSINPHSVVLIKVLSNKAL